MMRSSFPTMTVGKTMSASPPTVIAALVVMLPMMVLFVDGCFWHGCPKHCKIPASNRVFWKKKFAVNKARDRRVNRELHKLGWRIIRIWEHDLAKQSDSCVEKIRAALNS